MSVPTYFEDRMVKGAFKSMLHEHHFVEENGSTVMTDVFSYETPFGILGILFDKLYLENYMRKFLQKRNAHLKHMLEST
ncbi:hypothetical protein SAMN04487996_11123 [Dyadobacter soli]|uniref:Ligand-binding SRPBCC domain-containing protein n=2 Tax=Dyadobacter soli TaxID=659014 RepID=A0A1G7LMV8_9BACT|nr:hypothetical protein SAMN04487996_11123 [Dyadobacter soli]